MLRYLEGIQHIVPEYMFENALVVARFGNASGRFKVFKHQASNFSACLGKKHILKNL